MKQRGKLYVQTIYLTEKHVNEVTKKTIKINFFNRKKNVMGQNSRLYTKTLK